MNKQTRWFTGILLLISLAVAAADLPEDVSAYRDIQTLFSKGALEAAQLKIEAFQEKYPESSQLGSAENLWGLILILNKKPKEAIPHFEKALEKGGSSKNFDQYVFYNLGTAQFEAGELDAAQQTLKKIKPQLLDTENRLKVLQLRIQTALKVGQYVEAASEVLTNAPNPSDASSSPQPAPGTTPVSDRDVFSASLEQALQKLESRALEKLVQDFPNAPRADLVLLELVKRAVEAKEIPKANGHLQTLAAKFPKSAAYQQALGFVRAVEDTGPADPMVIGVLLPTRGKFAKYGLRSLQGIEKALGIFNPDEPDSKVTLYVEDSGEEPEQAIAALNRLVFERHAVAVVGPLLSKGIDQISRRAQELKVPLLTLTRHTGTQNYDYVVHAGLTMKYQAQEIARYAVQKLKYRKFAILLPREKIAEETARHFWDAVESYGGEITGYETYLPGETDFRQPIDKLSGLFYTEARQRELDALAKLRTENQIKKRTRRTEQYFSLAPIVDYQAVFIPDEPKVSGQILPTFAYRDVDNVNFLGTSAWNSPELYLRARNQAERAIFLDAFHSDPKSQIAGQFIEKYIAAFEQEPTAMEALAHDATQLLKTLLGKGVSGRQELLEKIRAIKNFPGVTGSISYQDGQLIRTLQFLTIENGIITEASQSVGASGRRQLSPAD